MLLVRIVVSVLLVGAAIPALHRWVWLPHRCNQIEKAAEQTTSEVFEVERGFTKAARAREAAQQVVGCIEHAPADVNLYMIVAANYRAVRRFDDAIAMYRAALRWDRRPELYFNIGETYLEMGNEKEAHPWLVAAALGRTDFFEQLPWTPREAALREAKEILEGRQGGWVLPR